MLRERSPGTLVTIVYFNSALEIPTDGFNNRAIIPIMESSTVEEMVALGAEYA